MTLFPVLVDQLKYVTTAAVLRAFSASPGVYRALGNAVASRGRERGGLPHYYLDRAGRFLDHIRRHQAVWDGAHILEVGTGWMHWESLVIRSFFEVQATLFDVWDNRQFRAFKAYAARFAQRALAEMDLDPAEQRRVRQVCSVIQDAVSFDEVYAALGFRYVVDAGGTLRQLETESFDFVFSYNVLEHVEASAVPSLVADFARVLKPGGICLHSIDLTDHLVTFARVRHISLKQYLRYSDETWKRFFENRVQYFNRLQRPAWLEAFQRAGFEVLDEAAEACSIDSLRVAQVYGDIEQRDLECKRLTTVHRKPK
jgi:SAM-dependent methyltransferase